MNESLSRLTTREREALRLLARGHDAKSAAAALGLSVHTVNERLREARRKLGVTSSREAARLLAAGEGREFPGDKEIGVAGGGGSGEDRARPDGRAAGAWRPFTAAIVGVVMIVLAAAAIGAWAMSLETADNNAAAPHVVATSPASDAVIAPGPFILTVTFDRPMMAGSYSFVQRSAETYPRCETRAALSRDARTFTLRCTATAGRHYEIWLNSPPYMNFKSVAGVPARPHRLLFRVRDR